MYDATHWYNINTCVLFKLIFIIYYKNNLDINSNKQEKERVFLRQIF